MNTSVSTELPPVCGMRSSERFRLFHGATRDAYMARRRLTDAELVYVLWVNRTLARLCFEEREDGDDDKRWRRRYAERE